MTWRRWAPYSPAPTWKDARSPEQPEIACRLRPEKQRCRTHYARDLLSQALKSAQPWVAALLRTVFEQPGTDAVRSQMRHILDVLEAKFAKAAGHLDAARADLPAFTAFPRELRRQIWSNSPQERLHKEIRRRTDVVGILPGRTALIRLVGAVLAEQNDEWTEARRYMGLELPAKARLHPIDSETDETVLPTELTAQPQHEITEWPSIRHSSGRDPALPGLMRGCRGGR